MDNPLYFKYELLHIPYSHEDSIRPGFYAPLEFMRMDKIGVKWDTLYAIALWSDEPSFKDPISVPVLLTPLYNYLSNGPKSMNPKELIGLVINVEKFNLIDGRDFKSYQAIWYHLTDLETCKEYFPRWNTKGLFNDDLREIIRYEENLFNDWLTYMEEEVLADLYDKQQLECTQLENDQLVAEEMELAKIHDSIFDASIEDSQEDSGIMFDTSVKDAQDDEARSEENNTDYQ